MKIDESWRELVEREFRSAYFRELTEFLRREYKQKTIFPEKEKVFRAFSTDLAKAKVVILGQDPYHTPGMADGLAFSVRRGQKLPPSLVNIYKEIKEDIGKVEDESGDLSGWQEQGVLLLNNVLTVEAGRAGSHRGRGWEEFTRACVEFLNEKRPRLVFILWGRDARMKKGMINASKHLIIESAHPSPLSAHGGFFGSRPFSRANEWLEKQGMGKIRW